MALLRFRSYKKYFCHCSGERSSQRKHFARQSRPPHPHRLRLHLVLLAEELGLRELALQADAGVCRGGLGFTIMSGSFKGAMKMKGVYNVDRGEEIMPILFSFKRLGGNNIDV